MANIFSLYGTIFVDNEKANKSIDETTKKGEGSGSKVSQAFGKIANGAVAVGTAVVTGAAVLGGAAYKMVKSTSDAASNILDASMKVGMSAEEYQKWAYAASMCGMEANTLEKAMIKQQKSFADAKDGSKSMSKAYERLGIDISKVGSSSEAFDLVIARLADMEDETTKNALANDIFGKSYAELGPMLTEGSKGINALKKEAVDLGTVMSNETVAAGEQLGDSFEKIKAAGMGIFNKLGSTLVPLVQKIADFIIDNMPTIQKVLGELSPIIESLFTEIVPSLMQLITNLLPKIIDMIIKLLPYVGDIIGAILPVVIDLITTLLPPIMQIIELILPLIISLLPPILSLLSPILSLLQPLIELLFDLLKPLMDILNTVLPPLIKTITKFIEIAIIPLQASLKTLSGIVSAYIKAAFDQIKNIFETAKGIFNGIIDFVKNVFTGNWKGAWNAVVKIFETIWNGIKNTFKIPLNFIIDGMNAFIRGLNKLKIPDWVPGVGGKGINIGEIRRLRVGLEYVPYDDFPAFLHKGERVLTASERKTYERMMSNPQQTSKAVTVNISPGAIVVGKVDKDTDINRLTEEIVDKIVDIIKKKERVFA